MIDIVNAKVSVPTALFAALSPGVLLQIPDKIPFKNANAFGTMKTSPWSVVTHAAVMITLYWVITKLSGLTIKKADLIVPAILFIILSPGLLLTFPPGKKGMFLSGETSLYSVGMHAVVFAVIFALLRTNFPQYY